ncbi:NAD-binding protein [Sanghuangporus baumii]|uniref:NAD-binding protein n=1 Tax=Sanghuangporus baumii TaxID=108892 RepID=A0A9Q5I5H4_SANBA|nr:NAD-binding protein [Sanghuangporus baumii]
MSSSDLRRLAATHAEIPYSRPGTPPPEHPPLQIGFCGLGAMGYLMARNLANHRSSHPRGAPPLLVYNRTLAKSEKLQTELGANKIRIAESAKQLAQECDLIITSLAKDEIVKTVYAQFKQSLSEVPPTKPKIFVETSTCYPTVAGELDEMISGFPHCHLITSPVFGAPAAADKAQLVLVMSGDYRSKKEAAYLLVPAIGRKVIDLGGNLEKAPTLKLIGNSTILGLMETMAEALTLGEKTGVGAPAVHELIQTLFPNPIMLNYANKMTNDLFDGSVGFTIDGGLKDAKHVQKLASDFNTPMPTLDIAHQNLLTARAIHSNQKLRSVQTVDVLDWSALVAGPRVAAGLDGLNSGKHLKVVKED